MLSVVMFVAAQGIIPPQTTSVQTENYSALAADSGKMIVMNCAANCTLTLPSTIQSSNWGVWVSNMGAGTVTINPNGFQLNGTSASITLTSNRGASAYVTTDNTNYLATIGVSPFVASIKPAIAINAIQYVDGVNGNDANDGLSPGSAKLTGCKAYDALPQYYGVGHYGQIIISGTYKTRPYWCSDVPNQGIWLMSDSDRNFVTISSITRRGGVVTATVSPNANTRILPIYVHNTNQVNGRIQVSGVADSGFNGQFVVTSMPQNNQIRWLQAGPNATSSFGNAWPAGFRVLSNYNYLTISGSPILLRIPAADYPSSVSWTEIQDYMDSMIFFGTNAPQGTVATLPHADFAMGGAGDQVFTRWTHNYTGNHQVSLPNADGTVMFGSGTSCAMSSGTTCTATVPNTATKCIAMQQGTGTVISGECSVSGTTATVTASLSNFSTWAIVAF